MILLKFLEVLSWSIIVTVSAWTTEVKRTRILSIKIRQEVVPQGCFDLTFDVGN